VNRKQSECYPTSIEDGKRNILNYISGNVNNLDAEPPKEHEKYEALNDAVRGAFASTVAVLQSACGGEDNEWQRILRTMSNFIKKDVIEFDFGAGDGWDDLSAERAVEMINHLPPSIEELVITFAPFGSPFIDGLIDWIEKKSTNLKSLSIHHTWVGGRNGGRDAGIRLSKTDLVGSRNLHEWSEAFHKMLALKILYCVRMSWIIEKEICREKTFDERTSTVPY